MLYMWTIHGEHTTHKLADQFRHSAVPVYRLDGMGHCPIHQVAKQQQGVRKNSQGRKGYGDRVPAGHLLYRAKARREPPDITHQFGLDFDVYGLGRRLFRTLVP